MRQCKVAFRNLIHRCKSITTRPLCCGVELLGKQQLILPLYTCTTSSPRNYSKFSTHITTERAMNLLCNLDEEERSNLRSALDKIDADKEKKLYEIESAAPPTAGQLYSIFFVNAVPFIAFGFLDNFIMIMAGEYIEYYLGHFITLSTMAAAGLGNTISDILGITMATYVENGCQIMGLKQPKLTPAQFELKSSKRSSSYGRVVGITVGCLLGMCPLWFMEEKTDKEDVVD
ncbi:transmembrane protein 65-like isoform X2 [Drosophila suzukii]|uniref:Transmembrane protein 65-like isoform X2 n=2 Tax=Drosophila suzukii TaxID=28584 RepID=A0ABM4TWL1_DROSZ|nr:transmembrane protein 65 isoform X2 [Drosophila suzukii]